jgi:hypothetical protein
MLWQSHRRTSESVSSPRRQTLNGAAIAGMGNRSSGDGWNILMWTPCWKISKSSTIQAKVAESSTIPPNIVATTTRVVIADICLGGVAAR